MSVHILSPRTEPMGGAARHGGGVEARAAPPRAVCMAGGYLLPSRSPERGKGASESTA